MILFFLKKTWQSAFIFYLAICTGKYSTNLGATEWILNEEINQNIPSYFLPDQHKLLIQLPYILNKRNIFRSFRRFRKAGFQVKSGHHQLMVGWNPLIPEYLIKKFTDDVPNEDQLENYIKRIRGAKVLKDLIAKHNFKHLLVPNKWLYKLPLLFSTSSYLLIVENMDIYDWDDPNGYAKQLYFNMDREILTELCTILHLANGCDAIPRNQPFTRCGKIAFVDTENVGQLKGHFIKHILPALNEELQAFALILWMKLEEENHE